MIVVEIVIPHSVDRVWEELRHIDRHVTWMDDARRIDFDTSQREGVGTSFSCLTRVGPFSTTDKMVITQWDDCHVMGVTHRGLVTGEGQFTLMPADGGTRLTWSESLHFPWWLAGALGAFLAKPILTIVWRKNLSNLARVLSATTPGAK